MFFLALLKILIFSFNSTSKQIYPNIFWFVILCIVICCLCAAICATISRPCTSFLQVALSFHFASNCFTVNHISNVILLGIIFQLTFFTFSHPECQHKSVTCFLMSNVNYYYLQYYQYSFSLQFLFPVEEIPTLLSLLGVVFVHLVFMVGNVESLYNKVICFVYKLILLVIVVRLKVHKHNRRYTDRQQTEVIAPLLPV